MYINIHIHYTHHIHAHTMLSNKASNPSLSIVVWFFLMKLYIKRFQKLENCYFKLISILIVLW